MAVESSLPPLPALTCAPAGISARYLRELLPTDMPAPLLAEAGIDPQRLAADEQYRPPLSQACALLEQALWRQGDPLFALREARRLSLKAFPWLGLSLLASTDLGTGLARLIELEPLVWDGSHLRLEAEGEQARLVWEQVWPLPPAVIDSRSPAGRCCHRRWRACGPRNCGWDSGTPRGRRWSATASCWAASRASSSHRLRWRSRPPG